MSSMRSDRRQRGRNGRSARTRAERRADERRSRALSHLQQVRGHGPARRHGRRPARRTGPLAFALGAVIGIVLAGNADWFAHDARIAAISVHGADHLAAVDVAAATGLPRDATFAAFDAASVVGHLTAHQWIAAARALRLPTGTLVVDVTERTPVGVVSSPASPAPHLVDAAGTPFAVAEGDPALPHVEITGPIEPLAGNADIARALALAGDLPRLALPRAERVFVADAADPRGFALSLEGVAPRVVLGWDELEPKLQKLSQLLATDPGEVASATEIDLRFAGQAVLRSDPPPEEAEQAAAGRGDAPPSDTDRSGDPTVQLTGG